MSMSESEAIKILKVGFEIKELVPHLLPAYSTAIKALEEIQEYKEIEQKLKETYGDWVDLLNFGKAYIDWIIEKNNGVPHKYIHLTDDHVDMWNEYKSLGTVEELKIAKEKQYKQKTDNGWIPCKKELPMQPKENPIFENKPLELYLVTVKNTKYALRAFWNGKHFTDGWGMLDVIAWQPLPEPYKPEGV